MSRFNSIVNLETRSLNEVNFWVNDIPLYVPPTSISIHKEGLHYSTKTLRTRSSTKIGSGNGIFHVQVTLTFPSDGLLQLHRLICQVKNNPFVFIENQFLFESFIPKDTLNNNNYHGIYFTLMGLNVVNHPSSPGAFTCELDLRLFNWRAHTLSMGFKDDFYETIYKDNEYKKVSFSVFGNQKSDYSVIGKENKGSEYKINTAKVLRPRQSKVYVRYCNFIQVQNLLKNFEIFFSDKREEGSIYLDKEIKEKIEKGICAIGEVYDFEKENDSFNEKQKELRDNILKQIFINSSDIFINYKEFFVFDLSIKESRLIKEFIDPESAIFGKQSKRRRTKALLKYLENKEGETPEIFLFEEEESISSEIVLPEENKLMGEYVHPKVKINKQYIKPLKDFELEIVDNKIKIKSGKIETIKSLPVFSMTEGEIIKINASEVVVRNKLMGNITYSGISIPSELVKYYKAFKNVVVGSVLGFIENKNDFSITVNEKFAKELKKIESIAKKFKAKSKINELEKLKRYIKYVNENQRAYQDREGLSNIFEMQTVVRLIGISKEDLFYLTGEMIDIRDDDKEVFERRTTVTSINGSLRHICPSIPILGQEYPTHQFLGSIEPVFQINLIGKSLPGEAINPELKQIESMRVITQSNNKNFPEVPGGGNIGVDSLITRLLGSYDATKVSLTEKNELRLYETFSLDSVDTFSIDGAPDSVGMNVRFNESRNYMEEEIRPARSNDIGEKELKKIRDYIIEEQFEGKNRTDLNLAPRKNFPVEQKNLDAEYKNSLDWKTKYFNSKIWYYRFSRKMKEVEEYLANHAGSVFYMNLNTKYHLDKNAYNMCLLLDGIQDVLNHYESPYNPGSVGYKLKIFSTIRMDQSRQLKGNHYLNAAADTYVPGLNVMEFAVMVRYLIDEGHIKHPIDPSKKLGIGMYGIDANDTSVAMGSTPGDSRGFVHIDLNYNTVDDIRKSPEDRVTHEIDGYVSFNPDGGVNGVHHIFRSYWSRLWLGSSGKDKFIVNENAPKQRAADFWNETGLKTYETKKSILKDIEDNIKSAIEKTKLKAGDQNG